ncbi:MAG: outer membrane beta-barrel protein [Bacteroidetes bacterium]|nr:outer membrane beta-barrel protein [Bacteroidota bacterium]
MKTQHNFFMFSFTNIQTNYIANATVIAASDSLVNGVLMRAGSQLTSPVNLSGYVTSNLFMNYSLPLKKIKCNLSLNAGLGYNRTPGLINEQKNITNNVTPNMGITLSSNISEKIDFSLSYNGTYTVVKNSLRTNADNNFFNHFANAKVNWMFWKGFVFNTSVSNTFYAGLGDGFNQNIFLWNAALGYKFLKDKSLDVRFSVNDILNQNNGISRTVNENYLEDTRTVVLQRYCLLTITYNLKFFNKNG